MHKTANQVDFEWEIQAHKTKHEELSAILMNNELILEFKN
jgi:hypothetical protein